MAKGDADDPAWRYVQAALEFAQRRARGQGYAWKGDSCYVVSKLALHAVIYTRNGIKIESGPREGEYIIPTDNPRDVALAYCDHYLHMRGEAARLGPHWRWRLETQTKGYDAVKGAIAFARDLPAEGGGSIVPGATVTTAPTFALRWLGQAADWALREGSAPLSKPSKESLYWGLQGIEDGMEDHKANPGIDNDPEWVKGL